MNPVFHLALNLRSNKWKTVRLTPRSVMRCVSEETPPHSSGTRTNGCEIGHTLLPFTSMKRILVCCDFGVRVCGVRWRTLCVTNAAPPTRTQRTPHLSAFVLNHCGNAELHAPATDVRDAAATTPRRDAVASTLPRSDATGEPAKRRSRTTCAKTSVKTSAIKVSQRTQAVFPTRITAANL